MVKTRQKQVVGVRITLLLALLGLLFFAVNTLIIVSRQGSDFLGRLSDIESVALGVLAVFACVLVFRRISKGFKERRSWVLIAVSLGLFTLGDIFWAYDEWRSSMLPLGSIADVFWIAAYVLLIAAIYFLVSRMFFSCHKTVYFTLAVMLVVSSVFICGHVIPRYQSTGAWEEVINSSYVVFDIVLLGLLVMMLQPLLSEHNPFSRMWFLFGLAFVSRMIFDVVFAYLVGKGKYYSGHPIDIAYDLTYVLLLFMIDWKMVQMQQVARVRT